MTVDLPPTGAVVGAEHRFPVRVYYHDTDAGGVVYHATYLQFADRARTELMRCLGFPADRLLREHGAIWVVRQAALDLREPARLDDLLLVATRLVELRGARIVAAQEIGRGGSVLARIDIVLALVSPEGKPQRIPAPVGEILRPHLDTAAAPRPRPLQRRENSCRTLP